MTLNTSPAPRAMLLRLALLCCLLPHPAAATGWGPFDLPESREIREVWVNPGFYSWHFETDKNLDGDNYGLGAEYRYSTTQSVMAGRYHNSDRMMSGYAVWLWQPLALGPVRLGALAGVIDGYPRANSGNWFAMAIPVASYEYGNAGINLTIVPTIPDTVHGSITIQLKWRVY